MMKHSKETFIQLIEANKGILFKVANSYTNDPDSQKDLVQDIIFQLWKSFSNYDERYKISTWMYKIALNVAISEYRKKKTRKRHSSSMETDFVHIAEEEWDSEQEEKLVLLRTFIDELDELNKALMILYLDGKSHEEIASVLHITTSNVGTKISRIKNKLKTKFQLLEE